MSKQLNSDDRRTEIALFRYALIFPMLRETSSQIKYQLRNKIADGIYDIPRSRRRTVSITTLYRWEECYRIGGFEALKPQPRSDRGQPRVISTETLDRAEALKWEQPLRSARSIADILAKDSSNPVPEDKLCPRTLRRHLVQRGATTRTIQQNLEQLQQLKNQEGLAESDDIWMLKLLQGRLRINEIEEELAKKLDSQDIQTLLDCILNKPLRFRNRAMTILAYANNISKSKISSFLFLSPQTINRYIEQFESDGVKKLIDLSKNAVKKHEDPKYIDAVFAILHAPPSEYDINRTTWKMEDLHRVMAEEGLGIARSNIRQIIKDAGYTVRKARKVLTSNDPNYRQKLKKITNILSNLGPKEKFFSIDEFGPISIKIYGGRSLVPPGKTKTVPQWQSSKGSLIITGALELSTNQMTHFYSEKKNTKEMIKLLEILLEKYADEECIYFSWDTASWHASNELYEKVEEVNSPEYRAKRKVPIVKLAPLPSSAQFLNVIESVFSGMAKAIIHNSDYASVEECMKAIDRYFSERNQKFKENPKRAGNKIWGKERVKPQFNESNNCKDPRFR
jgi:transposase